MPAHVQPFRRLLITMCRVFALAGSGDKEGELGPLDCRVCQGKGLMGADREPSYDTCNTPADPEAWRSDCVFCHCDGRGNNRLVVDGSASMSCTSCHPGMTSSESAWGSMSGEHRKHLQENFTCGNCHLDVTEDGVSIHGPLLHVDGASQIRFTDTRIHSNELTGRCAGNCHGENHENQRW